MCAAVQRARKTREGTASVMPDETNIGEDAVPDSVAAIRRKHEGPFPQTAIVLGSGLGCFGDEMTVKTVIPYNEIDGFPVSTVAGHDGRLLIGHIDGTPLICMQGRMHIYEGYPVRVLAIPIRVLKTLGVNTIILTNAAGSINPAFEPGSIMIIDDHINLSGINPLVGPNNEHYGPRFFDMTEAYDAGLRTALHEAAAAAGVPVRSGVYAQMLGPNFETPAEIRMLARLGADAVGMSTVPECLVARHCGMRVAGISVITNLAAGISPQALSHQETVTEAGKASGRMCRLLRSFFAKLA